MWYKGDSIDLGFLAASKRRKKKRRDVSAREDYGSVGEQNPFDEPAPKPPIISPCAGSAIGAALKPYIDETGAVRCIDSYQSALTAEGCPPRHVFQGKNPANGYSICWPPGFIDAANRPPGQCPSGQAYQPSTNLCVTTPGFTPTEKPKPAKQPKAPKAKCEIPKIIKDAKKCAVAEGKAEAYLADWKNLKSIVDRVVIINNAYTLKGDFSRADEEQAKTYASYIAQIARQNSHLMTRIKAIIPPAIAIFKESPTYKLAKEFGAEGPSAEEMKAEFVPVLPAIMTSIMQPGQPQAAGEMDVSDEAEIAYRKKVYDNNIGAYKALKAYAPRLAGVLQSAIVTTEALQERASLKGFGAAQESNWGWWALGGLALLYLSKRK